MYHRACVVFASFHLFILSLSYLMSLLQIAEPNQSAQPHQHRFGLGIDLGTTRSLVAVVRSGKAQVLEADTSNDTLLPSIVYYPSSGNP